MDANCKICKNTEYTSTKTKVSGDGKPENGQNVQIKKEHCGKKDEI
jgi:hypothetical protein